DEHWDKAENAIIEAAAEKGVKTKVEYGEAAFYGPKLERMAEDALGRERHLGALQVDDNLRERVELECIGADNHEHRTVTLHGGPFGSMERFIAVLLEHCAGEFPIWLSSEQYTILTISEKYNDYAQKVLKELIFSDIRGFVDLRN